MKISQNTLSILKNFSSICTNLSVNSGSVVRTIAPTKNIMAEAKVEECFDTPFGIWDLPRFLGTMSLFDDPEFDFHDKYVKIKSADDRRSIRYYYTDPELLVNADRDVNMPECPIKFTVKSNDLSDLIKASSVLQVPNLAVESYASGMRLRVFDMENDTSNDYSIDLGENESGKEFFLVFKVENLKLLPGSYNIQISDKNVSHFQNTNIPIEYWITLMSDSYINE